MNRTAYILISLAVALAILVFAVKSYGWEKSASADCKKVEASITNENEKLQVDGFIKANGVTKVTKGGDVNPHEVVTVSWQVPSGFSGSVEAFVALKKNGQVQDSSSIKKDLNCPSSPTPTKKVTATPTKKPTPKVTPKVTPKTTPTATPSATLTPTQGPSATPGGPTATPGPQPTATPGPKTPEGPPKTGRG